MASINTYQMKNNHTVKSVAQSISSFLENSQSMESQVLSDENGSYIVQGRARGGNWKRFVGMDKAITVKLSSSTADNILKVEIGAGRWIDKGLVMTLSMVVLWPLAVTSGFGIYQQAKLPEKIFDYVASLLA